MEERQDRRLGALQERDEHDDVGVGGDGPGGRVVQPQQLGPALDGKPKGGHPLVELRVQLQQLGVVQRQPVLNADAEKNGNE